ncbi:hypothetical protein [Methylomagnum sp.]
MNANQSTDAPKTPPPRAWVWHCTDESIAAGQISVIAIIETLAAVALYWWLSLRFEWHWFSMVGLIAAPMLLLRSDESVELGVEMLRWCFDRKKSDMSRWRKVATILVSELVAGGVAHFLVQAWLQGHVGWASFWRAGVIGAGADAFAVAVAVAIKGTGVGVGAGTVAVLGAFAVAFAVSGTDSGAITGAVVGASAVAVVGAGSGVALLLLFGPAFVAGILLRALFIRWFASLRYLSRGLKRLPRNWRENLLVIDLTHPPELLPQAGKVGNWLTVTGLWAQFLGEKGGEKAFTAFLIVAWYLPALAYRWSLKASAWLWWPLALALTPPFEGLDGYARRDRAAIVSRGAWSKLLLSGLFVLVPWLLLSWHSGIKDLLVPVSPAIADSAQKLLVLFPPPPMGLRYGLLWLAVLLGVVLAWHSHNLLAGYDKVLGSPRGYSELSPQEQQRFETQARPVERLRLGLIVVLFLLGEAVALAFAHDRNQAEIERLIWSWLLEWL